MNKRRTTKLSVGLLGGLALLLAVPACKDKDKDQPEADAGPAKAEGEQAGPASADAAASTGAEPVGASELDRLLAHLPAETLSVAYDRLGQRLDPAVVAVVFALPPKAGDLLDERQVLDEGLDIVLDGDADPERWLGSSSLGFTIQMAKSPYFLRPLKKPAAELGPLLEQGFSKNTVEGVELWLPTGSFPWRIALLDDEIAAFIPIDMVGTGLEPLTGSDEGEGEGGEQQASPVEEQLGQTLAQDPLIELVLLAAGPLVHFDVDEPIAQAQFALRRVGESYEGQVVLTPTGDADECADQLRARKHPEENQQVQALLGAISFTPAPEQGGVVGRLAITPDQLKHFLDR